MAEMILVIYDLDEYGEANGTVHFFCCIDCRSQSPYKRPDTANYGESSYLPDTQCELCGRTI